MDKSFNDRIFNSVVSHVFYIKINIFLDTRRGSVRNDRMVYVANIPYDVRWMELKDLVREKAGEVHILQLSYEFTCLFPRGDLVNLAFITRTPILVLKKGLASLPSL